MPSRVASGETRSQSTKCGMRRFFRRRRVKHDSTALFDSVGYRRWRSWTTRRESSAQWPWMLMAVDDNSIAGPRSVIEVNETGTMLVFGFDASAVNRVSVEDLTAAFKDGNPPKGIKIRSSDRGAKLIHRTESGKFLEVRKERGQVTDGRCT